MTKNSNKNMEEVESNLESFSESYTTSENYEEKSEFTLELKSRTKQIELRYIEIIKEERRRNRELERRKVIYERRRYEPEMEYLMRKLEEETKRRRVVEIRIRKKIK